MYSYELSETWSHLYFSVPYLLCQYLESCVYLVSHHPILTTGALGRRVQVVRLLIFFYCFFFLQKKFPPVSSISLSSPLIALVMDCVRLCPKCYWSWGKFLRRTTILHCCWYQSLWVLCTAIGKQPAHGNVFAFFPLSLRARYSGADREAYRGKLIGKVFTYRDKWVFFWKEHLWACQNRSPGDPDLLLNCCVDLDVFVVFIWTC